VPPELDDEEVQEDDTPQPSDQGPELVPAVPKPPPDEHLPVSPIPGPSRVPQPHPPINRSFVDQTQEDSDDFHSINESLQELEQTIADLRKSTSKSLINVTDDDEYDRIVKHHHDQVQALRDEFDHIHRTPPHPRPIRPTPGTDTSTPKGASKPKTKKSGPFSGIDKFFFGDTSARDTTRHTRSQGDVDDLPLPKRPPEYKPVKKK
jgi:hypothetical protein